LHDEAREQGMIQNLLYHNCLDS